MRSTTDFSATGELRFAARLGFYLVMSILYVVAVSANAQTPTGEEIVAKMASRYATIRTYQDSGVVLSHWKDKEVPQHEVRFKTYFVRGVREEPRESARPDHFRFEWISHHPYPPLRHLTMFSVIWADAKGAFSYHDHDDPPAKVERERDLSMAVAGATGVSHGSAHTVPRLLLNTVEGFALTQLTGITLLGQEEFEATRCFRVRGTQPGAGDHEMWIGADDFLLRKLRTQLTGLGPQEEIHRDIKIDGDIPEAIFHFEPPKDANTQQRRAESR